MPPSRRLLPSLLMTLVAYLTLLAVAALGLSTLPPESPAPLAIALLIAFGLLLVRTPSIGDERLQAHLYLALQTLIVSALLLLDPHWGAFPILFFILSAQAMLIVPQRAGLTWIAIFSFITAGIFSWKNNWQIGLIGSLPYLAGYLFFGVFAYALRQAELARAESQRLLHELQDAHRQLQEYAARAEELAISEERNRLAREMHDTLGHRLTVAAVQLEAVEKLMRTEPDRAAPMLATVKEQIRAALSELRQTVATLREPLESDLPLETSLPRLTAEFERATGLTVHLDLPEPPLPLSPAQRLTLYRAVQEGLTNVHRHARARTVWIHLTIEGGRLRLILRDDGRGPQPATARGFGLRGLHERAAQLSGEMRFGPAPEGGSRLEVSLPLQPTPSPDHHPPLP